MSDIIEIEGELEAVSWRNPHLGFTVRVTDENGQVDVWRITGWSSVYAIQRTGVKRDDFKIGERVKLAGYRSGVRKNELLVSHMLLASGVEALIRPDADPRWSQDSLGGKAKWAAGTVQLQNTAEENLGIFRVWSSSGYPGGLSTTEVNRTFTESAIAARADWDPLDNFVTRCEIAGMPALMTQPHTYQFENRNDKILLHGEVWAFTRTIEMNSSAAKTDLEFPQFGRSMGHWEGRTLIVETDDIDWPYHDSQGTPQGKDVKMREEFTLSEDQGRLDYQLIITDPGTLTEPATRQTHWLAIGEEVDEWDCEPDLYTGTN
jgi:hypothetical protein